MDILKTAWSDLLNENEKLATLLDEKDARIERLRAALTQIAAIENQDFGPDWEEIEQARDIARAALAGKEGT